MTFEVVIDSEILKTFSDAQCFLTSEAEIDSTYAPLLPLRAIFLTFPEPRFRVDTDSCRVDHTLRGCNYFYARHRGCRPAAAASDPPHWRLNDRPGGNFTLHRLRVTWTPHLNVGNKHVMPRTTRQMFSLQCLNCCRNLTAVVRRISLIFNKNYLIIYVGRGSVISLN